LRSTEILSVRFLQSSLRTLALREVIALSPEGLGLVQMSCSRACGLCVSVSAVGREEVLCYVELALEIKDGCDVLVATRPCGGQLSGELLRAHDVQNWEP
jgi:hypothetical protein